jgi:hypothetical protein
MPETYGEKYTKECGLHVNDTCDTKESNTPSISEIDETLSELVSKLRGISEIMNTGVFGERVQKCEDVCNQGTPGSSLVSIQTRCQDAVAVTADIHRLVAHLS